MSNYFRWTQHPDTMHWHYAAWIDDHFGSHNYGVKFNDGGIYDPREVELKTMDEEPGKDEIIDNSRDLHKEMFGYSRGEEAPKPPAEEIEIPTRKVKMLMVNPVDFMYLFTKGLEFRKQTKIMEGVPEDATLLTLAADPIRHGIMMVVESETYEPIPINEMPPVEVVSINTGVKDATKKKKVPRKKR